MQVGRDTVVSLKIQMYDAQGALLHAPEAAHTYLHGGYGNLLPKIEAAWGSQPLAITLAGIPPEAPPTGQEKQRAGAGGGTPAEQYQGLAQKLLALRDQIRGADAAAQDAVFEKALDEARKNEAGIERIEVPEDLLHQWVKPYEQAPAAPRGIVVDSGD